MASSNPAAKSTHLPETASPSVKTLDVFRILKFARALNRAEIAERSGLARSPLRRSIKALEDAGLVRCRLDGKYTLTAFVETPSGAQNLRSDALFEFVCGKLRDSRFYASYDITVVLLTESGELVHVESSAPQEQTHRHEPEFCDATHAALSQLADPRLGTAIEHMEQSFGLKQSAVEAIKRAIANCRANGHIWYSDFSAGAVPITKEYGCLCAVSLEARKAPRNKDEKDLVVLGDLAKAWLDEFCQVAMTFEAVETTET